MTIGFLQAIDFFSNPLVGVLSLLISLVGVLLAVYFYLKGKPNRKFVYHVNPAKAVVVLAGQSSQLKVTFNERVVEKDVTATQIALWNQGNQSIRPNNVLESIEIYTAENVPILEASVRKASRDIIDLRLDESNLAKGRLGVSWKILEPKDGAVVQLIYEGGTDIPIKIAGVIEGQSRIQELDKYSSDLNRTMSKLVRIVATMAIVMAVVALIESAFFLLQTSADMSDSIPSLIAVGIVGLLIGLVVLKLYKPGGPPFGY